MMTSLVVIAIIFIVGCASAADPVSSAELAKCVKIAEPLVYDHSNIFPLDLKEIRSVCRMWGQFKECIWKYANTFQQNHEKDRFYEAIQPSLNSIDLLCDENGQYHRDYLHFAPCMKEVSMQHNHCGNHYRYMADLVQGTLVNDNVLCCALSKFRECVNKKVTDVCHTVTTTSSSAKDFVRTTLNRGFDFLLRQCQSYRPQNGDCPGLNGLDNSGRDSPTPAFGWSTGGPNHNVAGIGNMFSSNSRTISPGTTKFTWPSSTESSIFDNKIDGPQPFVDKPGSVATCPTLQLFIVLTTILVCSVFR